eukprot:1564256-Amphidinium_carterae.2
MDSLESLKFDLFLNHVPLVETQPSMGTSCHHRLMMPILDSTQTTTAKASHSNARHQFVPLLCYRQTRCDLTQQQFFCQNMRAATLQDSALDGATRLAAAAAAPKSVEDRLVMPSRQFSSL